MINRLTVALAIIAGILLGQTIVAYPTVVCTPLGSLTPTLQLCKPAQGEVGWDAALNNNSTVLDSFYSGSTASPLITLKGIADPGSPAAGAMWLSTTTANTQKYADSTPAIRSLVDLSLTQTLTNKTLSASVLSGTFTGTYTLGGTPTISSPTISSPTLSGTVSGVPTWSSGQNFPSIGVNTAADATAGTIKGVVSISGTTTAAKNLRGTCTFAAATTCTVTFGTNEPDSSYFITLGCDANKTFWWSAKGTTGFTINASASSSDHCDWHLVR